MLNAMNGSRTAASGDYVAVTFTAPVQRAVCLLFMCSLRDQCCAWVLAPSALSLSPPTLSSPALFQSAKQCCDSLASNLCS